MACRWEAIESRDGSGSDRGGGRSMMSAAMDGHSGQSGAGIHGRRHHQKPRAYMVDDSAPHGDRGGGQNRPGGAARPPFTTTATADDRGGAAEALAAQPARQFRQNQRAGPSPMVWTLGRCAGMAVPLANIGLGRHRRPWCMVPAGDAAGPVIERSSGLI